MSSQWIGSGFLSPDWLKISVLAIARAWCDHFFGGGGGGDQSKTAKSTNRIKRMQEQSVGMTVKLMERAFQNPHVSPR